MFLISASCSPCLMMLSEDTYYYKQVWSHLDFYSGNCPSNSPLLTREWFLIIENRFSFAQFLKFSELMCSQYQACAKALVSVFLLSISCWPQSRKGQVSKRPQDTEEVWRLTGSEDLLSVSWAPTQGWKGSVFSLKHFAVSGFQRLLPKHSYLEKRKEETIPRVIGNGTIDLETESDHVWRRVQWPWVQTSGIKS